MPQQKKQRPLTIGEALKRPATAAPTLTIDDALKQPVTRPQDLGVTSNLRIGAEQGVYEDLVPAALSGLEALGAAMTGEFGPAKEIGELALRGAGSLLMGGNPSFAGMAQANNAAIQRIQGERQGRRKGDVVFDTVQQVQQDVQREAERDPSTKGQIARGAGRLAVNAAPATVAAIASGGSIPAVGAVTAAQSLDRPENMALNVGLSVAPIPVGQAVKAGTSAVRRVLGRGAAQVAEAEIAPAVTAPIRQAAREIPSVAGEIAPAAAPVSGSLDSAFQKLGTDSIEDIGNIIANANRRYRQTSTPEQIQSSLDDFQRINQLTLEEQRALSQVLPERTVSPVVPNYGGKGGYAREVRDIPVSEVDMQLDANLRELEGFFGGQGQAAGARMSGPQATAATGFNPPPLEAELAPPSFGVSRAPEPAFTETAGPRVNEPFGMAAQGGGAQPPVRPPTFGVDDPWGPQWANQPVQQEILNGIRDIPVPLRQRIVNEALGALGASKSLKSTLDVGSLLRQGGILLLRPLQWRQGARFIADTFRSFKTKNFEAINRAIAADPDAELMQNIGGFLSNRAKDGISKGEEAFLRRSGSKISGAVSKIPGIKHSEQAYTTGMDVQRLGAFKQYKAAIDKAGLSPEEAMKGYKAAAQWVNITTGRGSLGQRLDKTFDALNFFLFSPRYVASRLNILNPAMYVRNARTPGGRVVLKQQMSDLMQFAAVTATTMKLAQAAGADVGLNPNSPDFLKIKVGTWRYDTLAGLQQAMRVVYRIGAAIARAGLGEKPKFGESAIDVGQTFLNYKLSPPARVFTDFIKQRTPSGKPFTYSGATADLVAPMQWWDFVEAYQKEGWGGVGMALPGLPGIGAQQYEQTPAEAAIEKAQPLYSELLRLNKKVSDLRRQDKEDDGTYDARVRMFGDNYSQYGLRLVTSPRFKAAPEAVKALALDRLNEQAKKLTLQEFPFPALTLDANEIMDSAENSKRNPARK